MRTLTTLAITLLAAVGLETETFAQCGTVYRQQPTTLAYHSPRQVVLVFRAPVTSAVRRYSGGGRSLPIPSVGNRGYLTSSYVSGPKPTHRTVVSQNAPGRRYYGWHAVLDANGNETGEVREGYFRIRSEYQFSSNVNR